ncbi:MAG: S-layer homology domain-containing protein [Clostridiales bacterium]|nr:S-layer homology domain-containing protein [Clostridiales bacterium]
MKRFKKGSAVLLVMLLIFTPSLASFANADLPGIAAGLSAQEDAAAETGDGGNTEFNGDPEYGDDVGEELAYPDGLVVYNLDKQEIIVGFDAEKAAMTPWKYKLFDESGGYTIALEDNAFFPYEVQFQYGGDVFSEWFETPETIVYVGGYRFSVESAQTDPTKIRQLGVWIGGVYVPARPMPKTFTNALIMPMSLLPLEEVFLTLDLTAGGMYTHTTAELNYVKLSTILSGASINDDSTVAWRNRSNRDGSYVVSNLNSYINLSLPSGVGTRVSLELIVGDGRQLTPTNTRYLVDVYVSSSHEGLSFTLYKQDESMRRTEIEIYGSYYEDYAYPANYHIMVDADSLAYREEAWLGLDWGSAFADKSSDVEVYKGLLFTAEDIAAGEAADNIAAQIWKPNMTAADNGYPADYTDFYNRQAFTFVLKEAEEIVGIAPFTLYVSRTSSEVQIENLYENSDETSDGIVNRSGWAVQNGVRLFTCYVYKDYPVHTPYYLRMFYVDKGIDGYDNHALVARAVRGHYDTKAEVEAQPDVRDQLFPASNTAGYPADYSGRGQNFTILDAYGNILKITVQAVQVDSYKNGEPGTGAIIALPNPGNPDTYFQVNGATELTSYYQIPYQHDTYYDLGYQTILYLDDVELDALKPTFWKGQGVDVYAGGNSDYGVLQTSGTSEQDFSVSPVQYAAASESGLGLKNYWVTFVKKDLSGPKLFVSGMNAMDKDNYGNPIREVFLNDVYSNYHDIFIANVGSSELTGLRVYLMEPTNVTLDRYWTVQNDGNSRLAAFDTVESKQPDSSDSAYGELPNVAKIRLQAVEINGGEGLVSGTLLITADGQEDIRITLSGYAGNPRLTTEAIPEAVKYVPYAVQLLHNNKYEWNQVTMYISSGALPPGLALKPNGEIYGVPTAAGIYHFTVELFNSDTRFEDSSADYTIVVQENTNDNVYFATDPGYEVTTFVGISAGANDYLVTSIADYEFVTGGDLGEFVDFWLNGTKLMPDTDYTSEPGSTRITIKSQTFQNKADHSGINTIAAEFRVDGDEEKALKRAAQNFRMHIGNTNVNTGNTGSASSGSAGTSVPGQTIQQPAIPLGNSASTGSAPSSIFRDVKTNAWYYAVVAWAYEKGYMVGIGDGLFAPDAEISDAMVAVVLARFAGVDMTPYANLSDDNIVPGQWYSDAAVWAKSIGLFGDETFNANPPKSRGSLAIMLERFINWLDVQVPVNTESLVFDDADQMLGDENETFQTLNKLGVFVGKGQRKMDPRGNATRAEMAALLHRIESLVERAKQE